MCYSPYPVCLGRKFRFSRILNSFLVIVFQTSLCDNMLSQKDKNKIRLLQHAIRLFYKDTGFRVSAHFKNKGKCKIEKNDIIYLVCTSKKAAIKKLLSKIAYEANDYKQLKQKRKYTLNFTFFFTVYTNIKYPVKNITLDIHCTDIEIFNIFFTLDINTCDFFFKDMYQLLFYYYLEELHQRPLLVPDQNEIKKIIIKEELIHEAMN
jgi:hypothetical protein